MTNSEKFNLIPAHFKPAMDKAKPHMIYLRYPYVIFINIETAVFAEDASFVIASVNNSSVYMHKSLPEIVVFMQ